ncbi:TlpA family protein disulfide reductase [Niveibacterium terrae]|uniref:TlpA family protein disulfide reductase n=1 Tax=Niveibacterium terrae TaxID=3373598 RepID=UPI003A8FF58E
MGLTKSALLPFLMSALLAAALGFAFTWREPAPALALQTLDGTRFTLAAQRGKVVFVSFWASGCPACVREMPYLTALDARYAGRGLRSLAVAVRDEDPGWVRAFARRHALPFPVAHDASGAAAKAFGGVALTPTAFLIDRRGRIALELVGEPDWGAFEERLKALLAEAD